jgi:hypothetical protein
MAQQTYQTVYEDKHIAFQISNIEWEPDSKLGGKSLIFLALLEGLGGDVGVDLSNTGNIQFKYGAPAVSVDAKGRFTKHDVIGGTTVRQKTGEEPLEVKVTGVCKESIAKRLAALRDAKYGDIKSNSLPQDRLTVQFSSVSTSPMNNSGAVEFEQGDAEFLYNFDLSCVEITKPQQEL